MYQKKQKDVIKFKINYSEHQKQIARRMSDAENGRSTQTTRILVRYVIFKHSFDYVRIAVEIKIFRHLIRGKNH